MSGDIVMGTERGEGSWHWLRGDAAKRPVECRAAATTENHPVQNVSSTEIEKLLCTHDFHQQIP